MRVLYPLSRTAKWFRVFEAIFLGLTQKLEYERLGMLLPRCWHLMLGELVLPLCFKEALLSTALLERGAVS